MPVGAQRPNIIVLLTDDVGYNEFGYTAALNGLSTQFETPRIDALAQQSSILSTGYVTAALCSPSRGGLLTGQYPHRFGWEDNVSRGQNGEIDGLPVGQATIASQLRGLGYSTAAMGKWHAGTRNGENRPQDVGFDDFFGFLGGARSYYRYPGGSGFDINLLRGDNSVENIWHTEGDPSLYDPVKGRYLTDALGEEAASYIDQHASDANPFFLYVAFNATHTPREVKQQDYDRFAHITDVTQRSLAAMSYAMDRAVGMVLDSVETNNLTDNTVIVFANDNGGENSGHSNAPFYGHKGGMFEGSLRVPFLIRAPGVVPGTYDKPVSTLDLLPTFVSLAEGDVNALTTDGVDLMPFLEGESTGNPHETLFWRLHDGRFAVRKGDWKLMSPGPSNPFARLHNLATHPNELTYFNSQQPAVVADLVRELTIWEAGVKKAEWGALGARTMNNFDHFVYRHEQGATGVWSTADQWYQGGTTTPEKLTPGDAYANAILEFRTNDSADYTATNDMLRATRYTFMLNELRFTGDFAGVNERQATINGNALLMVKSLSDQLPRLRLDAIKQSGAGNFLFRLDNELQLLDNLEITGNGTEDFVVAGAIRDYFEPRGVIKSGSSNVRLSGNNLFTGSLIINEGRVTTSNLVGSVVNNGGIYAPGASAALTSIDGGFVQNAGTLELEVGGNTPGTQYDQVAIDGLATLGGTLSIDLINGFSPELGQTFQLITAVGGVVGSFDNLELPVLSNGMWRTIYDAGSVSLFVALKGDYDGNGIVDSADYVVWRKFLGTEHDYNAWRERFGQLDGVPIQNSEFSVPEPAGLLIIASSALFVLVTRPTCRRRPIVKSHQFSDYA